MRTVTDYPAAHTVDDFRANLAAVRARIDEAASAAGRDPGEVRLLPVSKTVEADRLRNAVAAGCAWFGENKVQEAKRKHTELADTGVKWAVIGHLQTNKAKDVAAIADEFQALDSIRLAEALDRRLAMLDRTLDVYVQVNTSGEESKFGLPPGELLGFLGELAAFDRLRVQGLMALAANSDDEDRVRGCFRMLRELRDAARDDDPALIGAGELSMGMSGDYALAIAEGSTCVRVGQAIFGKRDTPDSHYWPAG
ncbi:MAG: YggS family pyridoxal phosphate-dependent enzyme [Gordonia sp. (in: high G+C Gram-positive bacteria)]|uniref:YggS family pyridoxal phosphate-dependent enzyme n=1 Tax=Gordonia sp. (in: high G+C Gram-positive bacteria) TaxID=84139 RepID=UPI0039E48F08